VCKTRSFEPVLEGASASGASKEALPKAWRAKPCVCALAGQLARERSRLLKAERLIGTGIYALAGREDELAHLEHDVLAEEAELAERRAVHNREELAAAADLEASCEAVAQAEERLAALDARAAEADRLRAAHVEQRRRLQERLERVSAKRRQLAEERGALSGLRFQAEAQRGAVQRESAAAEAYATELDEASTRHAGERANVAELRMEVRSRQDALEPIREDLQTKEVDLDERRCLLERQQVALVDRGQHLERIAAEFASASERLAAGRRRTETLEQRLSVLWDDIHQRQRVLEDIGTSLHSREERVNLAQHTLVCAKETEKVRLELNAAELADRAWRERSAALASQEEELIARVRLLEAMLPSGRRAEASGTTSAVATVGSWS